METKFTIEDNYAIIFEDRHIDLHNNFYLVECNYSIASESCTLIWIKNNGEWVDENELNGFELVHSHVRFIHIGGNLENSLQSDSVFYPTSHFILLLKGKLMII